MHGPISIQVLATPMSGFFRSASVKPTAFSIARAGARLRRRSSADSAIASRHHLEGIGQPALVRLPARVRAERAQHRRELGRGAPARARTAARRAPPPGRRRTGTPRAGPGIGRDSSLVRSMPRSANTLSALNSAPGSFGSEKTIVVLSGDRVVQRPPADDEEARDVVVEVLDRRRRAASGRRLRRRAPRRSPPRRSSLPSATILALPAVS